MARRGCVSGRNGRPRAAARPQGAHGLVDRDEDVVVGDVPPQTGPTGVARRLARRPGDGHVDLAGVQLVDHLKQHSDRR